MSNNGATEKSTADDKTTIFEHEHDGLDGKPAEQPGEHVKSGVLKTKIFTKRTMFIAAGIAVVGTVIGAGIALMAGRKDDNGAPAPAAMS